MEEDASLLVALATKDLKELLHVCSFISYGMLTKLCGHSEKSEKK